jgi:hypothetical protein
MAISINAARPKLVGTSTVSFDIVVKPTTEIFTKVFRDVIWWTNKTQCNPKKPL